MPTALDPEPPSRKDEVLPWYRLLYSATIAYTDVLPKIRICLSRKAEEAENHLLSFWRHDSSTEQPRHTGKAWHTSHFNFSTHYSLQFDDF